MAHWRLVTPRLVRAIKEAGGELYVWTVDDGAAHRPARAPRRHRCHHQRPAALRSRARRWRRSSPRGPRPALEAWPASVATSAGAGAGRPGASGTSRRRASVTGVERFANVKLQPYSTGAPLRGADVAPARVGVLDVDPAPVRRPVLRPGSASSSRAPLGVPGIDARMPIASGCLAVSQTLTVAHTAAGSLAAATPGSNTIESQGNHQYARRIEARESSALVMDPADSRSEGVTATTATLPATADRALDFDALYRESRDDVFAYAATLLRDGAAAEDVTAHGVRARLQEALTLRRPPRLTARVAVRHRPQRGAG